MRRLIAATAIAVVAAACGQESGISPAELPVESSATTTTVSATMSSAGAATTPTTVSPAAQAVPTTVEGDTTTTGAPPAGSDTTLYEEGTIDPGLRPYIDIAVTDLAGRLNVDPSAIEVLSASLKTWSDASMGCPQPDMRYLQVPQDGSIIELQAGGTIYRYHSGGNRLPFLCEQPLDKTQPPPPIDLTGGGDS